MREKVIFTRDPARASFFSFKDTLKIPFFLKNLSGHNYFKRNAIWNTKKLKKNNELTVMMAWICVGA